MKLILGSDHAGVELRVALSRHLSAKGFVVTEYGPAKGERADYPDVAATVARSVVAEETLGVLICGTGIGVSIAANKVAGIRAALVHDPVTARLACEHNRANVLCLGARLLAIPYALELVDTWLAASFEARHQHRLDKITALEQL